MNVTELLQGQHMVKLAPDDTLGEAADLMKEYRLTGLPVVDDNERLLGVITLGQMMHFAHEEVEERQLLDTEWRSPVAVRPARVDWESIQADKAMITDVVVVPMDCDCRDAAQQLVDKGVHRAVVIDRLGRPMAMVSSLDFTRMVAAETANP